MTLENLPVPVEPKKAEKNLDFLYDKKTGKKLSRRQRLKRAFNRREEIRQMILKEGFAKLPSLPKLADKFGCSLSQIKIDIKKIRKELPWESPALVALSFSQFVKDCVKKIEKDIEGCKSDDLMTKRYKKDALMAMALLLEKEIIIKTRMGVIKEPEDKEDKIVVVWKSGKTLKPMSLTIQKSVVEEPKVIDVNKQDYEELDSTAGESRTSDGDKRFEDKATPKVQIISENATS